MGSSDSKAAAPVDASPAQQSGPAEGGTKKLKACCACPETKKIRDECVLKNGEESCKDAIEAHKACMRAAGFNV